MVFREYGRDFADALKARSERRKEEGPATAPALPLLVLGGQARKGYSEAALSGVADVNVMTVDIFKGDSGTAGEVSCGDTNSMVGAVRDLGVVEFEAPALIDEDDRPGDATSRGPGGPAGMADFHVDETIEGRGGSVGKA